VREPVYYGADSAQAYDFVTGLQATKDMLASLDPAAADDALRGLRVTLAGHTTRDGVLFRARTWIITPVDRRAKSWWRSARRVSAMRVRLPSSADWTRSCQAVVWRAASSRHAVPRAGGSSRRRLRHCVCRRDTVSCGVATAVGAVRRW
jgi:hypothetical protein